LRRQSFHLTTFRCHSQVLQMQLDTPKLDVQNTDAGDLEEALARQEIEAAKPLRPLQVECLVLIEMLRGYSPKLKREMRLSEHVQSKMGVEVVSVEIIWQGTLQQRYFHVPEMCKHLSKATRMSVVYTVNRENQDSKLADFVEKAIVTLAELKHQEWLKHLGLVKFFSRSNQNLVRSHAILPSPPSRPSLIIFVLINRLHGTHSASTFASTSSTSSTCATKSPSASIQTWSVLRTTRWKVASRTVPGMVPRSAPWRAITKS
jgi:hypothetical protein